MIVLRQLPRNSKIIKPVRIAAIAPSRTTPAIDAFTNMDWSESSRASSFSGRSARMSGSLLLHVGDDFQRGGISGFQDGLQHGSSTVHSNDVRLRWVAVSHKRHVPDINRRRTRCSHRQVVQFIDCLGRSIRFYLILERPDFRRTCREDDILRTDRIYHVARG